MARLPNFPPQSEPKLKGEFVYEVNQKSDNQTQEAKLSIIEDSCHRRFVLIILLNIHLYWVQAGLNLFGQKDYLCFFLITI